MRPVRVVMLDVFGEHRLEVTAAEDGHPVEALARNGAGDQRETRVVVDDHEHVEPAEDSGVDVASRTPSALGLGGQELRLGRSRPAW